MTDKSRWEELSKLIRKWILVSTTSAGSGHPTSSLSATDLTTVLFESYFTYDLSNPIDPNNDRFILSKGHASPLFYALYAASGAHSFDELRSLREFGSRLEGHPSMYYPYTDAATGSLGQGLSIGAGLAYIGKHEGRSMKSYVLMGDGELAEGQVWEACNFASYYKLDNLVAIADINKLGQSQETMFGHDVKKYEERFRAFGFETVVIDGHDYTEIHQALEKAHKNTSGKPFAIVAKTLKGQGVSFLAGKDGWHGKALSKDQLDTALEELGDVDESLRFTLRKPTQKSTQKIGKSDSQNLRKAALPESFENYKIGSQLATREVYGNVLSMLAQKNLDIYALDGDVKNSTFSMDFLAYHKDRFIECFIAEQNMVGIAVGLQRVGKIPFVSTFAAFLTRAADQIRMAGISHANIKFVGSHAGVSIGEDGPSQMGLEDIALFAPIPQSVILHPSDAVSTAKLLPQLLSHRGISYLRTLRPKTEVIYKNSEEFVIGGSKVLKKSSKDEFTIVAAGITVSESLKAYDLLQKEGIHVRVIDCYSIKPIDTKTLTRAIKETKKPVMITVEDHYEFGGLGDSVLSALSLETVVVSKLAVSKIERSGKMDELLKDARIDAASIVQEVKRLLGK